MSTLDKSNNINGNSVYTRSILNKSIYLSITDIGSNISEILEKKVNLEFQNRCIVEGFIKSNSCKIISYSSGKISNNKIVFNVIFECYLCYPVEGMIIDCKVENITKAGIKAVIDEDPSPVVIFIARDHHYNNKLFASVKERQNISIKVIGQRFELNDEFISIIGELVEKSETKLDLNKSGKKIKLKIGSKKSSV